GSRAAGAQGGDKKGTGPRGFPGLDAPDAEAGAAQECAGNVAGRESGDAQPRGRRRQADQARGSDLALHDEGRTEGPGPVEWFAQGPDRPRVGTDGAGSEHADQAVRPDEAVDEGRGETGEGSPDGRHALPPALNRSRRAHEWPYGSA